VGDGNVTGETSATRSLGQHMLHGSFWMILLRWAIRLTGLVSTVILARILMPADFGIVAMATFVTGLLELLNQSGQKLAIIRHHAPERQDYDTAWTICVIAGSVIAISIIAIAPLAAIYFREPRVERVMQCLAIGSFLGGFENIGITCFRRELKFHRFFQYNVCRKFVAFVVTVGVAIVWRNYWALVAGILSGQIAGVVLSFAMHAYRPRFSLARLSQLWSFSTWTLLKVIGDYLNAQIDQLVVGGVFGSSSMGRYSVGSDLASSPTKEITDPMVAALYPVMSRVRSDHTALRRLYMRTFGWSAIICFSAAIGTALVAHDMIHLVLGSRWTDVEPILVWLALAAGLLGLSSGAYTAFDAIGRPDLGARMQWTRLIILGVILAPVGLILHSLVAISIARLIVTAVFIPTLWFTVGREIEVSPRDYARELWRPAAGAAVMSLSIHFANRWLVPGNVRLACDVLLGAASFAFSVLSLWWACRKPDGPERDIWRMLVNGIAKMKGPNVRPAST
jgi:lipopolysaccharide exporter